MTPPVTKRLNQSSATPCPFSRIPNPVVALVFSFLGQEELLLSVNRVNKQARPVVVQRLSNKPRMVEFFRQLIGRESQKNIPDYAIVARHHTFPYISDYLQGVPHTDRKSWLEDPTEYRWRDAHEIASSLHLSPFAEAQGYALFCQTHPSTHQNAFQVANFSRDLLDSEKVFSGNSSFYSLEEFKQVPQAIEMWQKFLNSCDFLTKEELEEIGPYAENFYTTCRGFDVPEPSSTPVILRSEQASKEQIHMLLIVGKWALLLQHFITLLSNPDISTENKKRALLSLNGIHTPHVVLLGLINSYNKVADPFSLHHLFFQMLAADFPSAEQRDPAALILWMEEILQAEDLRTMTWRFCTENQDSIPKFEEFDETYFDGQDNFNLAGAALVLKLLGILCEN